MVTSLSPQSLDSIRAHLRFSPPPAACSPAQDSSESFSLAHMLFTPPATPDRRRTARTWSRSSAVPASPSFLAAPAPAVPIPNRWSGLGYSSSYRPALPPLGYPKPCVLARAVPYRLPSLPEHPLPPPVPKPSSRSFSVSACVDAPATQCKRSASTLAALPAPASGPLVRLPADETASDHCMASLLKQAVTVLGREWLSFLSALSNDSDLFTEASQSSNPQALMLRVVQRFAPSTLERYFAEWRLWTAYCTDAHLNPACPHPGALPDWLHSRSSQQGLAMGPIRALTWFGKQAGLPHLLAAVHSPMAKSFLSPTNPSERRESLPLPLSFVVWLERLVVNPATTPADVLFYGAVLTCTWASLRWAHALWIPPARLVTLVDKGAIVGVCLRTKTTKRAMPFAFLISGFTGSASTSWATRYLSVLRQAVADTLSSQPDRTLDFLPLFKASGSALRPTLSRPLKRDLAVPRLLQAIREFWRSHDLFHRPVCMVFILASLPSWLGAASSVCTHPCVAFRAIIVCLAPTSRLSCTAAMMPYLCLTFRSWFCNTSVLDFVRCSLCPVGLLRRYLTFRSLCHRLHMPFLCLPLRSLMQRILLHMPFFLSCVPLPPRLWGMRHEVPTTPASVPLPSPEPLSEVPGRSGQPHDDADSLDSASSVSADSGPSEPELLPDTSVPAPDCSPPQFLLYNHRSNVLHAAVPADPCFLSTLGKRVDGHMLHFRPACGSRAQQLSSSSVVDSRPSGAQPCLRAACVRQLKLAPF